MPDPFLLRASIISIRSPTSDYSDPDAITVSGVVMKGEGIRDRFLQRFEEIITEAITYRSAAVCRLDGDGSPCPRSAYRPDGGSL